MTARAALQDVLLGWFRERARPLAWRTTCEPYAVLVSEVMLQQTQAARVEPAWRAFLERFPTVEALAAAPTAEVVTAWKGLGYNRRAVNLQRAARRIVDEHGGVVPDDLDGLRSLPGVGEYTARAVLAFAFGRDAAPVDTNVARVLARAVAGRALGRAQVQALADELVPPGSAREWNAALMDLGAGVCTARSPVCGACPVHARCRWAAMPEQPDPAAAGALRPRPQGRFEGSDRYHRGRLLDALRERAVEAAALAEAAAMQDRERALAVAERLVADGLAQWRDGLLVLPEV